MTLNKHGSVFLLAITLLSVVFILGFALTFFTGSEDYSSAMSYESEVAFNLAESAIEELVARLKHSLNHDDDGNQLYKVLRYDKLDITKEIPLDATQVANLTALTRQIANEEYGILFNRGLTESADFNVSAVLKLEHIKPVEAAQGDTPLYKIRQDDKEKQGELQVTARIIYKGHEAKVSLSFLIRCVKTFVPPFNYFTLFVRDATLLGGSDFNGFKSSFGTQKNMLRLDNGWRFIDPDFDAYKKASDWERKLSMLGNDAFTPPGRVYLGEDPLYYASLGQPVPSIIRITNGSKVLPFQKNMVDTNSSFPNSFNSMDSLFLRLDVPNWTRMDDYRDDWVVYQGQVEKESETKDKKLTNLWGLFGDGWGNKDDKCEVRTLNVGSGIELREPPPDNNTAPTFGNLLNSFFELVSNQAGYESFQDPEISGFHPFGICDTQGTPDYIRGSAAGTSKVSPTLVYGNAMTQYYRVSQIKTVDTKTIIDLPYASDSAFLQAQMMSQNYDNKKFNEKDKMTASQAYYLFKAAGLPEKQVEKIKNHWNEFPVPLTKFKLYRKFMSDSGSEFYNKGLAHFLEKKNYTGKPKEYDGDLSPFVEFPLENDPKYPYYNMLDKEYKNAAVNISQNSPMREFYEGPLMYAMPDPGDDMNMMGDLYLYDFYFIPRSTEDFFRGRKTVAIGGVTYDRFEYKYINDVQQYRSDVSDQVIELNGILALNDRVDLELKNNLRFQGHGIIYSSPMMGGGVVRIKGNLLGADFEDEGKFNYQVGENLLTIIAPQIIIDTTKAPGDRCFIEANLMSLQGPIIIQGSKPFTIKGTVVTTSMRLDRRVEDSNYDYSTTGGVPTISTPGENIIMYNPLNGIWRPNMKPEMMDSMYVAKIVTGGVGKFDWKYER